jgi:hypothetical protein
LLTLPLVDGIERGKTADGGKLTALLKAYFVSFGPPSLSTRDLFPAQFYIFRRGSQYA